MSNTLSPANPTFWSAAAGIKLYKTIMFRAISDFSEEPLVKGSGDEVERPYRSDVVAEKYAKGTALTAQDLTYVSDTLLLDQLYSLLMYVDDVDKLQNKYNSVRLWSEEAGQRLGIKLDALVLFQAYNAQSGNEVDASELGGTLTEGITLTVSNMASIFGEINEKMDDENIPDGPGDRYFAFTPLYYNKLWQYIGGKESMLGDRTGQTGQIGQYGGLNLFKSPNVTGSAKWIPADNPANGDTLTIESVSFQFVSTINTVAGNILQTTDLAATLAVLVAFINNGGVEGGTGCGATLCQSLTTANQRKVQNWFATEDDVSMTVYVKGTPSLTVTGSESADTWLAKTKVQNCLAGRKIAISTAIQTKPMVDVQMASTVSAGKRGTNVMPLVVAGVKVFNQGTKELCRVEIRTDS